MCAAGCGGDRPQVSIAPSPSPSAERPPAEKDARDAAREARAAADIRALDLAVGHYYLDHNQHPPSLEILAVPDDLGKIRVRAEHLLDPWGEPYQYDVTGSRNLEAKDLKPDIWCQRPGFVIGNWTAFKRVEKK